MVMPTTITVPRFTIDEVESWPRDGNRYELVDGVLLVTPAPQFTHQVVALRLATALSTHVAARRGCYVTTPGKLRLGSGTLLEPDILVLSTPKLTTKWQDIHEHWLAVEVWSRSSKVYDRDIKRDTYLALGVREVWLVDWREKTVFVSLPGAPKDVPHRAELRWSPPALDPLQIDLSQIFRDIP